MARPPLEEITPHTADTRLTSVLLVDDDEAFAELSATFLERELDTVETTILTDPAAVRPELDRGQYDCLVSDYDMPGMDGLELLTTLRSAGIELPFVLFTGKGSEEIASRAISAGVDEYLQKGGHEEYPVLANKIENLVEKYWAETQVRRGFLAIESAGEGIGFLDGDGTYQYVNDAYASLYGRDREGLIGEHWDMLYPPGEVERFHDEVLPELERRGTWRGVSIGLTREGEPVPEHLVLTQLDDGGHACLVRERDRAEELQAELALKERALDAAGFGVFITDATRADNPIVYLNRGFEELTGTNRVSMLGRDWLSFQATNGGPDTGGAMRRVVDGGQATSTAVRTDPAEGDPVEIHLELVPLADETGAVTNVVGFQCDHAE